MLILRNRFSPLQREWNIVDGEIRVKGVNQKLIGLNKDKIRKILGTDFKEFKKTLFSKEKSDLYPDVTVFYKDGKVFEIELSRNAKFILNNQDVFNGVSDAVQDDICDQLLERLGAESEVSRNGLKSLLFKN